MSVLSPLREPANGKVAFAGDWHMNWRWAVKAIEHCAAQGVDVIVHVGDFGYDFSETFISKVTWALEAHAIPLIFVDGNHENFTKLYSYPIHENGLRKLTNYIWHAPRGFRWQWAGVTFLAMGGAHSVDRPWRILGESWWLEEHITDADILAAVTGQADVLISHDCPSGVRIPGIDSGHKSGFPEEQIRQSEEHRTRLAEVVKGTRPAMIIHGHYHRHYETAALFKHGHVKVIGLDCDESTLEHNVHIMDLHSRQEEDEDMAKQTVLDVADVGKLLGISADTVRRYLYESAGTGRRYSDHPLPAPDGRVGRSPYWNKSREDEIKAWAASRLGPGARPRSK